MRLHLFQSYLESQYNTFSTGTRRSIFLSGVMYFLRSQVSDVHARWKYLQW